MHGRVLPATRRARSELRCDRLVLANCQSDHLSEMTFQAPHIRALLIDISGTLLVGSSPTPGAAQALATLRAAHIPFRLCSNTSKESSDAVHKRIRAAGLDVHRAELWTSIGALRAVLKELGVKKYVLLRFVMPNVELASFVVEPCLSPCSRFERYTLCLLIGHLAYI